MSIPTADRMTIEQLLPGFSAPILVTNMHLNADFMHGGPLEVGVSGILRDDVSTEAIEYISAGKQVVTVTDPLTGKRYRLTEIGGEP